MEDRKRKISADLPPDIDGDGDEVIGPMPVQAGSKPEAKKRKGRIFGGKFKLNLNNTHQ